MKSLTIALSLLLSISFVAQSQDHKLDFLAEDWEVVRSVDNEEWEVYKFANEWAESYFVDDHLITPDASARTVEIVGQAHNVAFKPKTSETTWFNFEYNITIKSASGQYQYTVDRFDIFTESTTGSIFEFPMEKFHKGNGKWRDGYEDCYNIMMRKMNKMEEEFGKFIAKANETEEEATPEK